MPMLPDLLAEEMIAAIDGVGNKQDRAAVFKALASAIITHIQTNATAVGLVVTGASAAGPPGCIQ